MNRIAVFAAAALLSGCITTSHVATLGNDTYMISAANDTCGNCTPPEIRANEQAAVYCKGLGKAMTVKDSKEQTFDIGFGHRITLTFECR